MSSDPDDTVPSGSPGDRDPRQAGNLYEIERLLDLWEEAVEAGKPIAVEDLCRSRPDLMPKVQARIRQLQEIDRRIGTGMQSRDVSVEKLNLNSSVEELEFLNRGGLGAVYVGEDVGAHRQVAVKFLHPHLAVDVESRDRFALEAEVTARLEHPGVVPLYGVGATADGQPFYAMRFIAGQTMDDRIRALHDSDSGQRNSELFRGLEFRGLLRDFISVCNTIAYAHNRGIVHRDIKPANVMLGKYGETIVVDWGLAVPVVRSEPFRQSGEQTLMPALAGDSSSGHGAGTPVYMSPEQASKLAPTPASDIYSLGATLYKILCGYPPVEGETFLEIKQKVVEGRLVDIREHRNDVPQPLVAICRKALSVHPADRYDTALSLGADVERFLADEAVEAFDEPWGRRLARMARRHRSAAQMAVFSLIAFVVIATISVVTLGAYANSERAARKKAERLQEHSMATSAQFLSQSIAYEIDLRWRILEAEAASPILQELIVELNTLSDDGWLPTPETSSGEQLAQYKRLTADIQTWLFRRERANGDAVKSTSWFINAIDGTQIARVPMAGSIGKNFRHRDYFHGLGRDLEPDDVIPSGAEPAATNESATLVRVGPLSDRVVHMSAAYESVNNRMVRVAFSVPIWDHGVERFDRKRIGVLGMSVELGSFSMAANAWLIDTRTDQIDQQRGLILQHPKLQNRGRDEPLPHIPTQLVEQALELREKRRQMGDRFLLAHTPSVLRVADPIDDEPIFLAMDPVFISGRNSQIADTGWVVVVSEPDSAEAGPEP